MIYHKKGEKARYAEKHPVGKAAAPTVRRNRHPITTLTLGLGPCLVRRQDFEALAIAADRGSKRRILTRLPRANPPSGGKRGFSGVHTGFAGLSRSACPQGG